MWSRSDWQRALVCMGSDRSAEPVTSRALTVTPHVYPLCRPVMPTAAPGQLRCEDGERLRLWDDAGLGGSDAR